MDCQHGSQARHGIRRDIATRLRLIRTETHGEDGGAEFADKLELPSQTWENYESGVAIPGEILLHFIEVTGTEPLWLLRGTGPKYKPSGSEILFEAGA